MTVSLEESRDWCKSLAQRTGRNFYFSFLTLPTELFGDMCTLYAFMRIADDIGDDTNETTEARATAIDVWEKTFRDALETGESDHPAMPAVVDIVRRHSIPSEYFVAVLDGVRMDLSPRSYATFEQLEQYCYHVAGAVGLCCIHVWGFHDDRAIELAVDCGTAFQLTNILRDLQEDAIAGRVYLPTDDFDRFGYTTANLLAGHTGPEFGELVQFEVQRTRGFYSRAEELVQYLNPEGRPVFSAMVRIYGGILDAIERNPADIFAGRIRLPRWRKLLISADEILRSRWRTMTGSQSASPNIK